MQIFTREDSTFDDDDLTAEARWSYYISSFTMRDPTEGVPFRKMRIPFLKHNLPPRMNSDEEYNRTYGSLINHDHLVIRICASSYHMLFEPDTEEWWVRENKKGAGAVDPSAKEMVLQARKGRFSDKFVLNTNWMKGMSKEDVDGINETFQKSIKEGPAKEAVQAEETQTEQQQDEVMADA